MGSEWQFQVRLTLSETFAELVRSDPGNAALKPLAEVLAGHHATLRCQYDAFAGYVAEAEKNGPENYPLYKWTKATIDDPVKTKKHLKSFTVYVEGQEVYRQKTAETIESDLLPLVDGSSIISLSKQDTNPANNPQAPEHLR